MPTSRKRLSGSLLVSTMLFASPASAADLSADAVKNLVGGKMWMTERIADSRQPTYIEWKKDGTACLRLWKPSGKCDDSGTWKIDGALVRHPLNRFTSKSDKRKLAARESRPASAHRQVVQGGSRVAPGPDPSRYGSTA